MRAILCLLVALAALALAPAAQAAECGDGGYSAPRGVSDAPLVIGDSISVMAREELLGVGAAVDARICRRFFEGLDVMRERRLPSVVIFALGSNPFVSRKEVEEAVSLADGRLLAFVIPRELRMAKYGAAKAMRAAAEEHSDITILDWVAESGPHRNWFGPDGIHPRQAGQTAFAQMVGSFLAATAAAEVIGEQGIDAEPETLSDEIVYPQLIGSILRDAFTRVVATPGVLLGGAAPEPKQKPESDPLAPARPGRGNLPPWET